MKKIIVLATTILLATSAYAQHLHCGTDEAMQKLYDADPTLKARIETKNIAQRTTATSKVAAGPYTIPVVFHILHLGGTENISDAQVLDEMRVLNENYAKRNADTVDIIPSFKTVADSTSIRFVLATKDPQGNCTNGIVRYYDANSNWNDNSPTLYNRTWNPTKYMNVYVVKTITLGSGFGAAGYTWLPGTWNTNDPSDAIVVLHNYIGSIGTSTPFTSKTLTHEAGHWLNLSHVFGSTNGAGVSCNTNDYVFDTPTTKGNLTCPNASNPATYQICNAGVDENFQNYMDYSYCELMFTKGQAIRMRNALASATSGRNNLWKATNLTATGCTNPALCAPTADFKINKKLVCINVPVTYTDASSNGVVNTYSWTFQGGTPATSTSASEQVTYAAAGKYNVTLTVTNGIGSNTVTKTAVVNVVGPIAATPVANFNEGFENNSTFAQNWLVLNNDNDGKYFQTTAASRFSGTQSLLLNNSVGASVATDEILFPPLDFTGVTTATLKFRYAYAAVDQDGKDKLELLLQSNCNLGFIGSPRFTKTANSSVAANDLSPQAGVFEFGNYIPVPANTLEWKLVTLNNLASAYGNNNVLLKYVFTPGGGNNLYIDDIEIITNLSTTAINATELVKNSFSINPNPSQGATVINFELASECKVAIAVTTVLGQEVENLFTENMAQGDHNYTLNTAKLAKGLYLITLITNGNKTVKKLIVD